MTCDNSYSQKKSREQPMFSYESTFISYICICTPKVQHLLICRNRFIFFYVYHRPRKEFMYLFFLSFLFLDSVSPPHIRSAFTSKLQQLYKEGRPRKVRSGKHVVGRSETGYQLGFFSSFFFLSSEVSSKKKKKKTHFSRKGQAGR